MKSETKYTYMISIVLNIINFTFLGLLLDKVDISIVLIMLSIIPIMINTIAIYLEYKKSKRIVKEDYFLPISTLIIYIFFGIIVSNNGQWNIFRQTFTQNIGQMSVEIAESPISFSQILFCAIMYIAIEFLIIKFMETIYNKKGDEDRNVTRSKTFN